MEIGTVQQVDIDAQMREAYGFLGTPIRLVLKGRKEK